MRRRALGRTGITFVDTADVYSAGACEETFGKALRGGRDAVVPAGPAPVEGGPSHELGDATLPGRPGEAASA